MPSIRWENVFTQCFPAMGATKEELQALVSTICKPLSEEEALIINASQSNPFPKTDLLHATYEPFDPRRWRLPLKPLPPSFIGFLQWSNGGSFLSGKRWFDPILSTSDLREYLLSYHIPQYMPESLPFAFDGGGNFYLFDMRNDPIDGEYPILFTGAGNLGYEDAVFVADSFIEACKGKTSPFNLYMK